MADGKRYIPKQGEKLVRCPECNVLGIEGLYMKMHVDRCLDGRPLEAKPIKRPKVH